MIQAMHHLRMEGIEKSIAPTAAKSETEFADMFGSAASTGSPAGRLASGAGTSLPGAPKPPSSGSQLGTPDVQSWLNSYYAEQAAANPLGNYTTAASESYQPEKGAPTNFAIDGVFGPDAIFAQALQNQAGNAFTQMTGGSVTGLTSQLPGIPTPQAQTEFDRRLALENADRLASGQPIDTTAYWSDPGSITTGGTTYTSAQLGYAGAAQSSGAQPIFISTANQVGPNTYNVPGYSGTVTGIQPERYYTLQQLEKAGLAAGQPDAQFHPGSWTQTQSV